MSIARLNAMTAAEREALWVGLVPDACLAHLAQVDPASLGLDVPVEQKIRVIWQPDQLELHLRAPARRVGGDYCFSVDLEDAGAGQLRLAFVVVSDLLSPRYGIDLDDAGNLTLMGTAGRNLVEEERAVAAGLGPCQIRRGLRTYGDFHRRLERLARELGFVAITLEPLTYHNAVMYERQGFGYLMGRRLMKQIHRAFTHGGALWRQMNGSTPFRREAMADTVLGRSWGIHDGVLDSLPEQPEFSVQMFKVLGEDAGERTADGVPWG